MIPESWANFSGNMGKVLLCLVYYGIISLLIQLLSLQLLSALWYRNSEQDFKAWCIIFGWSYMQVSVFFDLVFIWQHYVLYSSKTTQLAAPKKLNKAITVTEPLISPDQPVAQCVWTLASCICCKHWRSLKFLYYLEIKLCVWFHLISSVKLFSFNNPETGYNVYYMK